LTKRLVRHLSISAIPKNKMDELDLFRIADTYTLTDAAALLVGAKPSRVRPPSKYTLPRYHLTRLENSDVDSDDCDNRPEAFDAALRSLTHAINRERDPLPAMKQFFPIDVGAYEEAFGEVPEGLIAKLDPAATTVDAEDLKAWLASRGVKSGFFFPDSADTPDYLDRKSPRYAPKLAAAVSAWLAVTEPGKKHPKQALEKWLREHAAEFGLTDDDGKPNETGIEEAAKVANWRPSGGAPTTTGR
jgi:hypothetical protein